MTGAQTLVVGVSLLHILFHVVGSIGVVWGLVHSHKAHKANWWKLAAALLWIVVSVVVIWEGRNEFFHHSETCQEHK